MTLAAIITAAGRGTRAGGDLPKQWQMLAGRPVVAHALAAFEGMVRVLTIHPDDHACAAALGTDAIIVQGAETRAGSVRAALLALQGRGIARVLIHDGARPLVSAPLIARVIGALDHHDGAAPALAVSDALWRGPNDMVTGKADRAGLYRAQTPQGFQFDAILAAHLAHQGDAADDVEVARAQGLSVAIVAGDEANIKLTYPADFARAAALMQGRGMDIRVGNGFDVHAFCAGDTVWLCGVPVPHSAALLGHSDADVGMHALSDAIYGALGLGDIGVHFPPSDPQWKGAASHIFLRHAVGQMVQHGFALANCDVTLICEAPKIAPHQAAMRAALAAIMAVPVDRISVKATTSEGLGFAGRREGIAAMATCALVRA